MTFWEHLDSLRVCIIKIAIVSVVAGTVAFFFKEELFGIILAPKDDSFFTYSVLRALKLWTETNGGGTFSVQLINTGLSTQFLTHMKVALYAGFMVASPYTLYVLFHFISPALYRKERKMTLRFVVCGYFLFIIGVLFCYYIIFPITFRFLGSYQVSTKVLNLISLQSYMDTFMMMNLIMGLVFELPVLCWLLAKVGLISASFMKKYRKYAIVFILVVAAIITPTSDIFTLTLVSVPIYLLYEASILIVSGTNKNTAVSTE